MGALPWGGWGTIVHPRSEILDWAEQGRIAAGGLRRALEIGAALPTANQWRRFLDRVLLYLGAVLLSAGVIFFFAFNWNDLGRFAKFALVQAPVVAALVVVWRMGLERPAGKAALIAAALLVGAVLALIGQTYQTGADTFELFAAWAVAILPWALVARFPTLWILWLALVNIAASFYYQTFGGLFGLIFSPERMVWVLFAINTAALVAWEACAYAGLEWLRGRWGPRLIATASGVAVTTLALWAILGGNDRALNLLAWAGWTGLAYAVYRHAVKDLFVLAGGALSAIVVLTALLGKAMSSSDAGSFLLLGVAVIGMSAAAGYWLRQVAAEESAAEETL
jgi:uncharacterized membrane protein